MVDWTGRMSPSVLPSIRRKKGNTQFDDCAMYCGDWNGLQRDRQGVHVWLDGAQEEDQWKYDIAPRKGLVPHAMETTVQGEGKEGHPEFPNTIAPCTSPEDHASNKAAETVLAKESSAQEGKRS